MRRQLEGIGIVPLTLTDEIDSATEAQTAERPIGIVFDPDTSRMEWDILYAVTLLTGEVLLDARFIIAVGADQAPVLVDAPGDIELDASTLDNVDRTGEQCTWNGLNDIRLRDVAKCDRCGETLVEEFGFRAAFILYASLGWE